MTSKTPFLLILALVSSGCSILNLVKRKDDGTATKEELADRELASFKSQQTVQQWWRAMDSAADLALEAGEAMRKKSCTPDSCDDLAAQRDKGRAHVKSVYPWIFDNVDGDRNALMRLGGMLARFQGSDDLVDLLAVDERFPVVADKLEAAQRARLEKGSMEQIARDTGEGFCVAGDAPGEPKALFRGSDRIQVRCAFPERLSSYKRDRPDVLRVDVAGRGSWITVTTLDVPSYDTTIADFELPVSRIVSSMERARKAQSIPPYKGSWIMVTVDYVRSERSGAEIRDNHVQDTWQHFDLARGEFIVNSG